MEAVLHSDPPGRSSLNDIDLVASDFHALPYRLGDSFLISHAHPGRPAGKLILQLVCPDTALRVDIFSAAGTTLTRTQPADIRGLSIRVVSLEDIASRIAFEMMGLARGGAVSAKCSADYKRLTQLVTPATIETIWQEQRRDIDPASFQETCAVIDNALCIGQPQLVDTAYSKTPQRCPYCVDNQPFKLAASGAVFDVLGYY